MFSKKSMVIIGIVILIIVNIVALSLNFRHRDPSHSIGQVGLFIVAPFQDAVTRSIRFVRGVWTHYFFLVSVSVDYENINRALRHYESKNRQYIETEFSNYRLRNLLDFQKTVNSQVLFSEVIGKDPSPWFKTLIIDKGKADGVIKGLPVMIPEGVVGQVADVSKYYSKVLLIVDQNSAVDALVQRTRARGIVKGESTSQCIFKYALRKEDIKVGDTLISSGLDGVFPKGLRIGNVTGVVKRTSGIFQEVTVGPFADFEKLEEVIIFINPARRKFDQVK
jgi:rod shape-determining protein MreC